MRTGDTLTGLIRPPKDSERYFALLKVETINYQAPEEAKNKILFENLTPLHPDQRMRLEQEKGENSSSEALTARVIDLVSPIGKGQRGLLVSAPKTGKTVMLQQIAHSITASEPDCILMVLLIDERPEEVTDFTRSVDAEVIASSNDQDLETHVRLSRLVIDRCRRLVESGKDVFVLLDSITRVARAFNSVHGGSGRTMTGGVDARALEIPRKIFASARKTEEAGSLTIIATALIDTGSRMDELIFQEFKGTGNMELVLDRKLAERRVYPAIDIPKSGTRKEEQLFPPQHLDAIHKLRRTMTDMNPIDAMETIKQALAKFKTNEEFLSTLK